MQLAFCWRPVARPAVFWRLARVWLERGWWNEEHAIPPCDGGIPKGKTR